MFDWEEFRVDAMLGIQLGSSDCQAIALAVTRSSHIRAFNSAFYRKKILCEESQICKNKSAMKKETAIVAPLEMTNANKLSMADIFQWRIMIH